jgi:hypothetical protein
MNFITVAFGRMKREDQYTWKEKMGLIS